MERRTAGTSVLYITRPTVDPKVWPTLIVLYACLLLVSVPALYKSGMTPELRAPALAAIALLFVLAPAPVIAWIALGRDVLLVSDEKIVTEQMILSVPIFRRSVSGADIAAVETTSEPVSARVARLSGSVAGRVERSFISGDTAVVITARSGDPITWFGSWTLMDADAQLVASEIQGRFGDVIARIKNGHSALEDQRHNHPLEAPSIGPFRRAHVWPLAGAWALIHTFLLLALPVTILLVETPWKSRVPTFPIDPTAPYLTSSDLVPLLTYVVVPAALIFIAAMYRLVPRVDAIDRIRAAALQGQTASAKVDIDIAIWAQGNLYGIGSILLGAPYSVGLMSFEVAFMAGWSAISERSVFVGAVAVTLLAVGVGLILAVKPASAGHLRHALECLEGFARSGRRDPVSFAAGVDALRALASDGESE